MLRVAIVGCGKIADEHARQIGRVKGATLSACFDAEPLMATQMHERYDGLPCYEDLGTMLATKPDVVHITTPPQSHYAVAMRCLEAGCHVFVEKPFTMTTAEAVDLLNTATRRNLLVSVDHNLQFSDPAIRMRRLIGEGFLGGAPVHLESYYCYDLGDPGFAKAFLSDTGHWVRSLPGGLLQNIISHGIARIAEHITSENPRIIAHGFTSPLLRSIGETNIKDELRVMISDDTTTAYFTFSSQMRPQVSQFRVFGPQHGLLVDDSQHVVVKLSGKKRKSYLENFLPPAALSAEYLSNSLANVRGFLSGRLHMSEGMKNLIERFYASIAGAEPLPIPYREIILTTRIMDAIFAQLNRRPSDGDPATPDTLAEALAGGGR
jgi:predicted dehydrogenase